MARHDYPTRDDYYAICIRRGANPETAARIADGLVEARERHEEGKPGWETITHSIPRLIRKRLVHLYNAASISHPSEKVEDQARSGLDAVFAYGVFLGMVLAERGHLISEEEREASRKSMPDIWVWMEMLDEQRKKESNSADDD